MRRLSASNYRASAGAALLTLAFAACTESPVGNPRCNAPVTVTPTTMSLTAGQTQTATASASGCGAAYTYTWRSNNEDVATVNATGAVTAVGNGQTLITATAVQDTSAKAFVAVTVTGGPQTGPVALQVVGMGHVPERYTSEVAVRGEWAYTSTWGNRFGNAPGNVVKVWNVAGNQPVLRDSIRVQGAGTTGDVQISDDGALLVVAIEGSANNGIAIYDRSNPMQPQLITRYAAANTQPGVHTVKLGRVNNRQYAFLSINPGIGGARLVILDITNPAAPTEVFTETMGRPYLHDVFFRDGILFTALWHDGFRIYDVGGGGRGGSPSAPVVMGSLFTEAGYIHNIWWFHDPNNGSKKYVFLGEEGPGSVSGGTASGDIHVIDVSNMSAPVQVAQYSISGAGTHNFWMDEASGILYAAYYNGGVRALDVRGDLGNCTSAQRNQLGFCDMTKMGRVAGVGLATGSYVWGVVHQGDHVYASDMKAGLYKLDVSPLRR